MSPAEAIFEAIYDRREGQSPPTHPPEEEAPISDTTQAETVPRDGTQASQSELPRASTAPPHTATTDIQPRTRRRLPNGLNRVNQVEKP